MGEAPGAFLHADFSPVASASAAVTGETILLFATGLGPVTPPVASGSAAFMQTTLTGNLQVFIGGRAAPVLFAGLALRFVGLYQINVTVPADLPTGEHPVVIIVDGIASTGQATVSVR